MDLNAIQKRSSKQSLHKVNSKAAVGVILVKKAQEGFLDGRGIF